MTLKTTVSTLAIVASGGPALAELDAATLWADLNGMAAEVAPELSITAGQTVETETEVRLSDVVISFVDGNDRVEVRVPGFALTETADGGVTASITGNGTFLALPDGGDARGNRVAADLTVDGLSLSFAQDDVMTVRLTAPLLGAVLTDLMIEGEAQPLEAAFSIAGLDMGATDTGEGGADRRVEVDLAAQDLTLAVSADGMEDVRKMDISYDVTSVELAAMLDAPAPLFWGSDRFDGDVQTMLRLSVGAGTAAMAFEQEPYDDGDVMEFSTSLVFDALSLDHEGYLPQGWDQYPNGQDLIPDDLVAHFNYDVINLDGRFSMAEGYAYDGSTSRTVADGGMQVPSAVGRVAISEAGDLSWEVTQNLSFNFDFEDSYQSETYVSESGAVFSLQDLDYVVNIQAPLDNAMMLYMQGLPEGVSYFVSYGLAEADFRAFERSGDTSETLDGFEFDGSASDALLSLGFTDQDARLTFVADRINGRYLDGMPAPVGADAVGLNMVFDVPINTGTATREYTVVMDVGGLSLNDGLWDLAVPGIDLDRGPMSLAARAGGEMRASTNPIAIMGLGMGMNPIAFETLVFDVAASAVGATVDAEGAFDTSDVMLNNTAPVGAADVTTTGLEQLLSALSGAGLFSAEELAEAEFLLNAFTVLQPGGERTMRVEINDQEHLIINGVRMQ